MTDPRPSKGQSSPARSATTPGADPAASGPTHANAPRSAPPSAARPATPRPLTALEERVVEEVHAARDELVALVAELVAYDTTARGVGEPPRDEAKLQRRLAARLEALGGEVDLWEPEPTRAGSRLVPAGLDFAGRPQLAAVLRGRGGGPSLLLNGHIDAVSAEPREQWSSDPFVVSERDGLLYGRGVNDMKGGIACLVVALEALSRCGVRPLGDVVFCTNTDEESSGAGGLACVEHGVRADAGICAEPTAFDAWIACRGMVNPTITIPGRPAHAEIPQPHWRQGGGVNPVEKLPLVLAAMQELREEWRTRPDHQHPCLAPGDIVPTIVHAGEWSVTYPAALVMQCDVQFLPGGERDDEGITVEREVRAKIDAAAAADDWLAEHPLQWTWESCTLPAEIPADHPLVQAALQAGADVGRPGKPSGLDSWHDAATFTQAGTPTFSYGPGGFDSAHAIDERVAVAELVDYCAAAALLTMRFCGVAG